MFQINLHDFLSLCMCRKLSPLTKGIIWSVMPLFCRFELKFRVKQATEHCFFAAIMMNGEKYKIGLFFHNSCRKEIRRPSLCTAKLRGNIDA